MNPLECLQAGYSGPGLTPGPRPGTAKGICFVSLEDETGISNVIVAPELFEAERLKTTGNHS